MNNQQLVEYVGMCIDSVNFTFINLLLRNWFDSFVTHFLRDLHTLEKHSACTALLVYETQMNFTKYVV